ncbi:glycosyltransferase family 2 protein [Magnetospirillum sp. 64-120]|uniref:glycosyltransferase family 2 protein n=1 Tax=Magnetospirillum sp. 64-120 TaxID=1895778 RepID=UPI00092862E0|nr:glycosyltransferase family 2 protein [Magnetospirillum sp. 64-120]OJX68164.1 MAG: hypothetical protein BGO92_05790 [Magnetospirillum sp. 64-120]
MSALDIVIPVYNEGENILKVFAALKAEVKTPFRVLICYDFPEDNTLAALADNDHGVEVVLVKNPERGPHAAVRAGLAASTAPAVLVYMADDDFNAGIIDRMVALHGQGCDVVAASRFVAGGCMVGCAPFKEAVTRVADFTLYHLCGMKVHDATNGFRLFSRRVVDTIEIESSLGFTYSIELLAKTVRLGWPVAEVPAKWFERSDKPSRFQVLRWIPRYLRWLFYGLATVWLRRGAKTVKRK